MIAVAATRISARMTAAMHRQPGPPTGGAAAVLVVLVVVVVVLDVVPPGPAVVVLVVVPPGPEVVVLVVVGPEVVVLVVLVVVLVVVVVVVGSTSTPVNWTARMPSTGELYNWTWLPPLAQNASVGRPKKPGFWNSWMRQMPLAEAIVGIWFQQPCEPPKGREEWSQHDAAQEA